MNLRKIMLSCVLVFFLLPFAARSQEQASAPKGKPHVIIVGVNGMELDVIRPLILKGEMPNLAKVVEKGSYGKLRTVSAPNCSLALIQRNMESQASSSEGLPPTPIC